MTLTRPSQGFHPLAADFFLAILSIFWYKTRLGFVDDYYTSKNSSQ